MSSWYGQAPYIPQPPPSPPELPEGASPWPRWPWWYGPVAFLAAQVAGLIIGIFVFAFAGEDGADEPLPLIIATIILDGILVLSAIWFAAKVSKPRPEQFGFRRTRFWPALGWTALVFFVFLAFAAGYSQLVSVDEQSTLEDLGADEGTLELVVGALLVIIVAPFVEEFFFRGFFYRAMRNKLGVFFSALVVGLVFGAVHLPSGPDAVPVLAVLGIGFCLLYELTGSLYPCIALHAFNNAIAYGTGADDAGWLAFGVGLAVILACIVLPLLTRAPRTRPALA